LIGKTTTVNDKFKYISTIFSKNDNVTYINKVLKNVNIIIEHSGLNIHNITERNIMLIDNGTTTQAAITTQHYHLF